MRFVITGLINGVYLYVAKGSMRGWPIWTADARDAATWATRKLARAWAGELLNRRGVSLEAREA